MNLKDIAALIVQNAPAAEGTIKSLINMFKATTAPTAVTTPAVPATGDTPAQPAIVKKPNPVVREIQHKLNQYVKPQPPLKEDGWLGDRTEAAILDGYVMAKPYLAMLGG